MNLKMDGVLLLMERRSVRKFTSQKVPKSVIEEIISICRWAPSWANTQTARYNVIEDKELIQSLAQEGVKGFVYNMNTLKNANGVVVLSTVMGESGHLGDKVKELSDNNIEHKAWESFDAGIACQTFCLAAYAKGVGTCIMGVIDKEQLARSIHLPENEVVAALIVFGYEEGEHAKPTPRKEVNELLRFIGE